MRANYTELKRVFEESGFRVSLSTEENDLYFEIEGKGLTEPLAFDFDNNTGKLLEIF